MRTDGDATAYAYSQVGENVMPDSGYCLAFVRDCFDLPAVYSSAKQAWDLARYRHEGDRNPPAAVPFWLATASPYDHVVYSVGGGTFISTYNDDVRVYDGGVAQLEAVFDGTAQGWAEDLNGFYIYATTPGEDDDMTPEQAHELTECRRMLGVLMGWQLPAAETEQKALDNLWGGGEARRLLGVAYGYQEPATDQERTTIAEYGGLLANAAEARRQGGVTLHALPPAATEVPPVPVTALPGRTTWTPRWVLAVSLSLILGTGFVVALLVGLRDQTIAIPSLLLYALGGGLIAGFGAAVAAERRGHQ